MLSSFGNPHIVGFFSLFSIIESIYPRIKNLTWDEREAINMIIIPLWVNH
jgi:hypothetical protein